MQLCGFLSSDVGLALSETSKQKRLGGLKSSNNIYYLLSSNRVCSGHTAAPATPSTTPARAGLTAHARVDDGGRPSTRGRPPSPSPVSAAPWSGGPPPRGHGRHEARVCGRRRLVEPRVAQRLGGRDAARGVELEAAAEEVEAQVADGGGGGRGRGRRRWGQIAARDAPPRT